MFSLPARLRWNAPESFDMFVDEFVPPMEIVFCPQEEGQRGVEQEGQERLREKEGPEGKGSIRSRVRRRYSGAPAG